MSDATAPPEPNEPQPPHEVAASDAPASESQDSAPASTDTSEPAPVAPAPVPEPASAPEPAPAPEPASAPEPTPVPEPEDRYSQALRRFSGDVRMATQVWDSMAERDVQRRALHHRLYLDALLAANEVDAAGALLDQMHAAGITTDADVTWRLALSRARSGVPGASERLDDLARTTPPPDAVLPRLFGIQMRAGRLGPAKATMRRMSGVGVAASNDDYRPMLVDILDRKAIKDAEALVEHLLAVGAPPSEATATALVTMMAQSGHSERGEQLIATFETGGMEVSNLARSTLIDAHAKANDLKATRRAIQALEAAGGQATSHHHNLVLGAVAGNGDLEGAWREALSIAETGIPSGDNLDRMMELALKRKSIPLALSAWDWMVMLGVPPSPARAAELVGLALREGDLDLAKSLYREVIRLEVTPDRRRGEELVEALAKADRLDEAKVLLNELRVRKVLTKGQAWGPVLAALARRKKTDEVVALLNDMVANKVVPTVSDASRTVATLTKASLFDKAQQLLTTLVEVKVTVDEPTYRELMWSFARKGRADATKAVLDMMTAAGITADDRHDKALAWASGETQRRLPDTPDEGLDVTSAEPSQPDTRNEATPPAEPSEPVQPLEPTEPLEPAEPVDPAQPTEPVQPLQPTKPLEPTDPLKPSDPPEPSTPGQPPSPIESEPGVVADVPSVATSPPEGRVDQDGAASPAEVDTAPGAAAPAAPVEPGGDGSGEATDPGDTEPVDETPEPLTAQAHEEAPTQPDLDDGTATPDQDKAPGR